MRFVVLAFVLAFITNAHADDNATSVTNDNANDLAEARRLEAALEYERALVLVERVIARGGAIPKDIAALHLFAGKLAAGLDRTAVAEDHFARVLTLEPATTLPAGTSPKLAEPFETARARTVPLRVQAKVDARGASLVVDSDLLGMVAGIAVAVRDTAAELREPRRRSIAAANISQVWALDAFGNRVWWSGILVPREVLDPDVGSHGPERPARPLYRRWLFWAALTGVALGVGTAGAINFSRAQDNWDEHRTMGADYTELQAIESRGRRWGWTANVSFGAAALSAVLGGLSISGAF